MLFLLSCSSSEQEFLPNYSLGSQKFDDVLTAGFSFLDPTFDFIVKDEMVLISKGVLYLVPVGNKIEVDNKIFINDNRCAAKHCDNTASLEVSKAVELVHEILRRENIAIAWKDDSGKYCVREITQ